MTSKNPFRLAKAWVDFYGARTVPSRMLYNDELDNALRQLADSDQEGFLSFLLITLSFNLTEFSISFLAASDFERILSNGGIDTDEVRLLASKSDRFRDLLDRVWLKD